MVHSRSFRLLDFSVWKACAGGSARVPAVGAQVLYFPEGHAEHATSPPDFSSLLGLPPSFACRVTAISLLAHHDTDEVYARISLDPCPSNAPALHSSSTPAASAEAAALCGSGVVSFAKVLTPSDANNSGGFSVPRFCADSIFPRLNYKAEPPVQTISVLDVHGNTWNFRHIFRGTPRRHLLTTGWSKFVNCKKLIAGNTVVFMRNHTGQLLVGVRRTGRPCGEPINFSLPPETKKHEENSIKEGFLKGAKGRLSPDSVAEAVRLAEMGQEFEVLYYPRFGCPEFMVAKEMVEASMVVPWGPGMRIKMAVEMEESSRTTWFQGTVFCAGAVKHSRRGRSLWRMLQVNWDEPEVLQNLKTVNPWQVELVSSTLSYPFMKRPKLPEDLAISFEGAGSTVFPMTGFGSTEMGNLTPSLFNLNESPFGRQGARHFLSSLSSSFGPISTNQVLHDNMHAIDMPWNSDISRSESITPVVKGIIHHDELDIFSSVACNPSRKSRKGSIQLFGRLIQTEQLADNNVSTEYSLSYPQNQVLDSQIRISAVRACE